MSVLILVACLAQLPDFNMGSLIEEPKFSMHDDEVFTVKAMPRVNLVFAYKATKCPHCDDLERDAPKLNSPQIVFKQPPAWTSGKGFPILHWETPNGWKMQEGYEGLGKFLTTYEQSLRLVDVAPKLRVEAAPRQGYPIRGSWWTGCSGWQHLTHGEHTGKFDQAWLASLSNAEVQSLHSDDHEGRVKWQYVVRPTQYYESPRQERRGLFGIFRSRSS